MLRTLIQSAASGRSARTVTSLSRPMPTFSNLFIKPSDLQSALDASTSSSDRIIPLCSSWFLPNDAQARTGLQTFKNSHIPSARFFDLDEICDSTSPYPHMLPDTKTFESAMRRLGIRNRDCVVVYDSAELGIFSAPRVAWTLSVFGHDQVHILNNFKTWLQQGRPVETGDPSPVESSDYEVSGSSLRKVVSFQDMIQLVTKPDTQILDARPPGRFAGTDAEPRPGLPSGHMPGAINLAFTEVLDPDDKTMLSPEKLRQIFEAKGIDGSRPIVSTCGTGVTAAVIDAALRHAGYDAVANKIYDGSWTEWAQRVERDSELIVGI